MRGNAVCDVDERVEEHERDRSHLDYAASSSLDWPAILTAGLCAATGHKAAISNRNSAAIWMRRLV